ncbi:16S rRNA (uracil(1498)-N(3))-methyltransferase [Desulfofustis glycolicus]|uniref:Ribosomal RNA small subunit methyltransferase E n=1 Tax=Desulfofustis glycolicus DSM 9705 TaxID=1121409 RepID=A0A1M5Y3P5_9BACT|nr:16S rRNA (uracil(1498)-N(3))-methyltransferase [Desulfofustis glycolicus]MCB2214875.1 16S rRNA (uracil(1498)-N(3))-methyltransferase [Desulfobulbaceae bacterium]SHI06549.1 RNA methyltransferase, RsmE family [Desulfofustis glycolicus DSM 9705]
MNIILLEADEIDDCQVRLDGRRADHIIDVLRARPGDLIKIGIINGKVGHGTIKELRRSRPRSVTATVVLEGEPPSAPLIDVLLALPRPIMLKRILTQLAALGIGRLYLLNAHRVEKSFWDASVLDEQNRRQLLLQGLEQAVDTMLPLVTVHRGFRPFIEDELPQLIRRYKQLVVAHPGDAPGPLDCYRPEPGLTLVAVGPEGGWNDYEVGSLVQSGFSPVSLGPRILRVETAVIALHALFNQLCQREVALVAGGPPPL